MLSPPLTRRGKGGATQVAACYAWLRLLSSAGGEGSAREGRVAAPTKPGRASTARWCGSGERDGRGVREERSVTDASSRLTGSNLADKGSGQRRAPVSLLLGGALLGRAYGCLPGGHGGALGRVARRRGHRGNAWAPPFVERIAVNTGTVPVCPVVRGQRGIGAGSAVGRPARARGGAAVVLRAGESPAHGEGRQRLREGEGGCNAARCAAERRCSRSGPSGPWSRVAGMQSKLHRWAAADPGRRFDDLFNFVHDPAHVYGGVLPGRGEPGREHARRGRHDRLGWSRSASCPGIPG